MNEHYKVVTHDYRPPLQGGEPVWDGATLPYVLPPVALDTSSAECAPGWHSCDRLADALRIGGLWGDGYPACVLVVEPSEDVVHRGDKSRSSGLTILRRVTRDELAAGISELSVPFGKHRARMVASQLAWLDALGRPGRDEAAVEEGLREALAARAWGCSSCGTAGRARAKT